MFNIQEFLRQLDEIYKEEPKAAERVLKDGLRDARFSGNDGAVLVILNELLGYYRVMGNFDGCENCAREALELCERMGIKDSDNYATVLLNIATAYRVMGKMEEAENDYLQVFDLYNKNLGEKDYRRASLHNNLSLLYSETGRAKQAKEQLERAMDIIVTLDDADVEIAITYTNLGNICFQMQDIKEGTEHMEKAVEIFEAQQGKKDVHYASALSGLGQAYFLGGKTEQARDCYQRALTEIQQNYGENEYYQVTMENLQLVEDTISRSKAVRENALSGLELSRKYYETCGKPMLEEKYPAYAGRIACGLCGEGSECLGFDDEYSADHDYGPSFCMWLTEDDYREIGDRLQKDYEQLPAEFMGFPARNTTAQGGGRVGVMSMDDFFRNYTGFSQAPKADAQWMEIEDSGLRTVTNGEVFSDPSGEFTRRQKEFSLRPDTVTYRKLALELGRMAQSGQYNFPRMTKRGDRGAAFLAFSEFVSAAADAAYLLNRQYAPFYKWKMRGMEQFDCMTALKEQLEELIAEGAFSDGAQEKIEKICGLFVGELRRQKLSESEEMFLDVQKSEVLRKGIENEQEK